jgi:iron complex outermembrane receptor protein
MRHLMCCVAAAALLGIPAAAVARQAPAAPSADSASDTDIGEVVVTARRREEKLADVPVAASVIDQTLISDRGGNTSVLDLLAGQAGVRFFNTTSPINSEISIRASPTARATSADPSVGLYRNGAYIGGGAVGGRSYSRLDLFDVGRVEILRGAQGALYGRNAVGGAVNLVSAQPVFENTGYVDAKYGAENQNYQLQAVANFALSDDMAIRIGTDIVDQRKGFFYNPSNDVYFDHQDSKGYRGQFRWKGERSEFNLLLEHQSGDIPAITYRVVIAPGAGFPLGYKDPAYSYNWNAPPIANQKIDGGVMTYSYAFDWATLSSTTAMRRRTSYYQFDPDATNPADYLANRAAGIITTVLDTGTVSQVSDSTDIFTQDVHLTGVTLNDRLDWLVGAEILRLDSDSTVTALRTPTLANPSVGTRSPVKLSYDSWAVYGSVGYDITQTVNVSAELRYTDDEKSFEAHRFNASTNMPVGGAGFIIDADTAPTNASYNLIGSWRIPGGLLAYAKVGSSYRSGGFNTNLGTPVQPEPIPAAYDDETSTTYELGLKGYVIPRVYISLAAFKTETDNLIVQTDNRCTVALCGAIATAFLTNAGASESWGVEAEAVGRFNLAGGQLRLSGSLSRQDGKVVDGDFQDLRLPQTPDWIYGLDASYRRPFFGGSTISVNLNYNGQQGGVQELIRPVAPPAVQPPNYDLEEISILNGRLAVDFGHVEVAAWVSNLTDSQYAVFASSTTQRLNQPRNYGLQLRYRW